MQSNRIGYLDSLRGLAALGVACVFHYTHFSSTFQPDSMALEQAPFWTFAPLQLLYRYGLACVDLFFVLSGIIFAHKYVEIISAGQLSGIRFFRLRFARLYPLHLLSLLIVAVLVYSYYRKFGSYPIFGNNDLKHFVLNLFFVQHGIVDLAYSFNGPAWSLSVEAVMYLLFWLTCRQRARLVLWVALCLVGISAIVLALPWPLLNDSIGRGLLGFFSGCLLQQSTSRSVASRREALKPFLVSAAIVFCMAAMRLSGFLVLPIYLYFIGSFVCLLSLMFAFPILQRLVDLAPLRFLGDISLGVYLLHIPIQIAVLFFLRINQMVIPFEKPWFLLLYTTIVIAVSKTVHYAFELPAQKMLRGRSATPASALRQADS